MSKMNTVKININNFHKLKNIDGDDTIDRNVNKLISIVKSDMPIVTYSSETKSIKLYPETLDQLDLFRLSLGESRDNIITRLLIAFEEKNGLTDDELIAFKLTSTINSELKLTGALNSTDIFPDVPLDRTYKYKGRDLSSEFHSWVSVLDWNEIQALVLKHSNENAKYRKPNYYLEINP